MKHIIRMFKQEWRTMPYPDQVEIKVGLEIIVILSVILALTLLLSGCSQRECQYDFVDPNGVSHTYHYKSNSFASDTSADGIKLVLPDGTVLKVFKIKQDNDSLKAISPAVGIVETK